MMNTITFNVELVYFKILHVHLGSSHFTHFLYFSHSCFRCDSLGKSVASNIGATQAFLKLECNFTNLKDFWKTHQACNYVCPVWRNWDTNKTQVAPMKTPSARQIWAIQERKNLAIWSHIFKFLINLKVFHKKAVIL